MRYQRVVWSPVEEEWLSKNKTVPINQLTQALAKSRSAIQKKLIELNGESKGLKVKKKQISKIGKRKDCNNQFFRSSWEANVYRYLQQDSEVVLIEIEPTTFSFAPFGILKGTVSYTPDFKVTKYDGTYFWLEVKGFLRRMDKTKLKRFRKYYPEEAAKLYAVTGSETTASTKFFQEINVPIYRYYNFLKKTCAREIPGWES